MESIKKSWLACRPIAHRGLHDETYPENSLPAFIAATEQNYPIELDVQLSADNELVVFHDYSLLRMTGDRRNLRDVTISELSILRLGNTKYSIPTFDQVLQIIDGRVPLLIEIKNEGRAGYLEELLCFHLKEYRGEFAIESFNPLSLMAVKKICPEIHRGQLSKAYQDDLFLKRILLKNFCFNFFTQPSFIAIRLKDIPNKATKRAKAKGIIVCCWTVKTENEQKKALKYCDNYIFEKIRP